jgi:hypothetical protein
MILMRFGMRRLGLAGQWLRARTRHRGPIANMPRQGLARTMKPAILNRFLYCSGAALLRVEHHGRRAGDRVDRHVADTCNTL